MSDSDDRSADQSPSREKRRGLPIAWLLVGIAAAAMVGGVAWDVLGDRGEASLSQARETAGGATPSGVSALSDQLPDGALNGLSFDQQTRDRATETVEDLIERAGGNIPGLPSTDGGDESRSGSDEDEMREPEAVIRLGFGFAAGFAASFALKKLFKLTEFAAGVLIMMLMGLEYGGLIAIQWGSMADRYDSFQDWAGGQFESVRAFATVAVHMAATAMAGLAAGWKAS